MSATNEFPSRERLHQLVKARDFATLTAIPYEQDEIHLERLEDLFKMLLLEPPPRTDMYQSAEDVAALVKFVIRCLSLYQWSLGLIDSGGPFTDITGAIPFLKS